MGPRRKRMPGTDPNSLARIREVLNRDREWSLYALGDLAPAAGTHLVNRLESVAAIGNVFCLPDYRRQGLGARVTSAVVNALIKEGIRTIGLNVSPENPAAQLYRRLGFADACLYVLKAALRE